MCCVTIGGYHEYLLPADQGIALVKLLQSAFETEKNYGSGGYFYYIGDQPEVSLNLVKASQLKQKPKDGDQLLIGGD
jgi:hypothetical protein